MQGFVTGFCHRFVADVWGLMVPGKGCTGCKGTGVFGVQCRCAYRAQGVSLPVFSAAAMGRKKRQGYRHAWKQPSIRIHGCTSLPGRRHHPEVGAHAPEVAWRQHGQTRVPEVDTTGGGARRRMVSSPPCRHTT